MCKKIRLTSHTSAHICTEAYNFIFLFINRKSQDFFFLKLEEMEAYTYSLGQLTYEITL